MTVTNDNSPLPEENLPGGMPLDGPHGSAAPTEEAHALEGAPADEAPADEAPSDEASADESSVDESSVDESSVDESSADEAPAAAAPPTEERAREVRPLEEIVEEDDTNKEWYILKVQSNREESIKDGLLRRVRIRGLERYFGDVIVPTEMVTEFKNGKKRIVKRKLYPGYIIVNMTINDDTWFLIRETPGIGDFTGAGGKPMPMHASEVSKFLAKQEEKSDEAPKLKISFKVGDRVKINEGTFENFEGAVESIDDANGRVTVMINIFGRSTPVELEYWQVENV